MQSISLLNRINKTTSFICWIILLFFIAHSFCTDIITAYEAIICVAIITISCWIVRFKCNTIVKWGIILVISALSHVAFINVNLDIKYLFVDIITDKTISQLYLMYGVIYMYCLCQQWNIFFTHKNERLASILLFKEIMSSIVYIGYIGVSLFITISPSQFFIFYFPLFHYSMILLIAIYLRIRMM